MSAICGYCSTLSAVFRHCLPNVCTNFALRDLLCSFELECPNAPVCPPSWDLMKVLEYLRDPVFEPLSSKPFRVITVKTCFCSPCLRPNGWVTFRAFCVVWCLRVLVFICRIYLKSWPKRSPRGIPFLVPSLSNPCPSLLGTCPKSVFCIVFMLFVFIWMPPLL